MNYNIGKCKNQIVSLVFCQVMVFSVNKYNGDKVGNTLSALQYNENIKTATIKLNDGTDVTATVVYKK